MDGLKADALDCGAVMKSENSGNDHKGLSERSLRAHAGGSNLVRGVADSRFEESP
jgi:hypothetical protein